MYNCKKIFIVGKNDDYKKKAHNYNKKKSKKVYHRKVYIVDKK